MATTTSFFPPNPEDGELWLPSYLCHEISLPNAKSNNNAAIPSPPRYPPNRKQVRDTLHGAKTTIGNGQPYIDPPHNYPYFKSPLHFVRGPFYPQNPTTSPNQFLGHNSKISSRKSEGTGVFLPGSSTKKEDNAGKTKGTGVFLKHQTVAKPRKGGENGKGDLEPKRSLKDEIRAKTQDLSDHHCLPQDWSY